MSATSSLLSTLLSEFKSRYPMGAIVAELSTVHEGSYVVRALVQIGNTSFASGMAIATDIELAEDQAKVRALQAFGISVNSSQNAPPLYPSYEPLNLGESVSAQSYPDLAPLSPSLTPSEPLPQASQALLSTVLLFTEAQPEEAFRAEGEANPTPNRAIALPFEPASAHSVQNLAEFSSTPNLNLGIGSPLESPLSYPDLEAAPPPGLEFDPTLEPQSPIELSFPEPEPPSIKPEKSTKRKTEPKPSTESSAIAATGSSESGDRSNEIARIGVEMKRLSWTTEQGRGYLKRTYGKRSRQELDDIELLDFLRFLEAQPSPSQPLF